LPDLLLPGQARGLKNVYDIELAGVVLNREVLDVESSKANAIFSNSAEHARIFEECCWTPTIRRKFLTML